MSRDFWVGVGIAGFGLLLLLVIIPFGVASPKNVRAIFLSPVFWPNIVAGLLILGGGVLALSAFWQQVHAKPETPRFPGRLLLLAILMPIYAFALSWLGMVWASILAFATFLIIGRTRNHFAGVLTALILPLILYAFFYHVAGVAVPQGEFVRLP